METQALALADAPSDIMGIRAAAAQLDIAPSTLSRQVTAGKIPNRGTSSKPKVSVSEAKAARAANLDPVQQRSPAARGGVPSGLAAQKTEHERIKVVNATLDLAERQGALLVRAEAGDFIATLGARLRDALLRRWRTLSTDLAGLSEREIETKGIAADEEALHNLVADLDKWAAGHDPSVN